MLRGSFQSEIFKNAFNTLTKLIFSHLTEVLGCLASACSGRQNRFPEQYVARKPSKLIYLVLWGDIERPPVIGRKGKAGRVEEEEKGSADGKLLLFMRERKWARGFLNYISGHN